MRVLVVEDEVWLRRAAIEALRPATLEVRGAGTVAEARDEARRFAFDAALVDLGLPDGSGIELLTELRGLRASAALVAYTIFEEPSVVYAALRAGARGYLLKSHPLDALPSALEAAAQGGSPVSPAVARHILDAFLPVPSPPDLPALTPRERDVLTLLARGHTYADVARALDLRLGTIQSYVKSLYDKLAVASKAEAAVAATKLGLD